MVEPSLCVFFSKSKAPADDVEQVGVPVGYDDITDFQHPSDSPFALFIVLDLPLVA